MGTKVTTVQVMQGVMAITQVITANTEVMDTRTILGLV
jgi:hypothetical protein